MVKKYILIIAGTVSLLVGIIGIIIPIMPTSPFLLLSSYCYIKSSENLYLMLKNNKVFGKYISKIMGEKIIGVRLKIVGTLFIWFDIFMTYIFLKNTFLKAIMIVIGIIATIVIIKIKKINIKITN